MAVSHQPRSELNASTTSSASRSQSGSSDGEYATMTRHLSNSDSPRSPKGHLDYDALTRTRAGSRSTASRSTVSSDVSGGDDVERVMMRGSIVHEASESDDDDDDDDDDSHNTSDYVQYNPAKLSPLPPLPQSPGAVFNDDCSSTERSAGSGRLLRPRIQSASVLQSSQLCDEELQVSDVVSDKFTTIHVTNYTSL